MLKNKLLFIFKRCDYNDNKMSLLKNHSFLLIISFVIIKRSFKFIIKNKLNENDFNIEYIKNILNKKKLILIFKVFKKKMI